MSRKPHCPDADARAGAGRFAAGCDAGFGIGSIAFDANRSSVRAGTAARLPAQSVAPH
jgi:hypothetical protein